MVVRLDVGTEPVEKPVVARVKPLLGEVVEIQLKDDGTPPDVTAGDGTWSGASFGSGDEFAVSASLGATTFEGGAISWTADDAQRDLTMTLRNGMLTAEAGVSASAPTGNPVPGADGAPTPGGPAREPTSPGGASAPAGPASETSGDATLYVAFGVGGLLLAVLGYLWYQRRPDGGNDLPDDVVRLPELGILGADTPAISAGLSVWVGAPKDAHDLVRPALATLARHHRVLVAAPKHGALPAVRGGPVYRITEENPRQIADAIDGLNDRGGPPLAVLVLGESWTAEKIRKLAASLPDGVGGIVLSMEAPAVSLPVLHCARRDAIWALRFGEIEVLARDGAQGLERVV